MLLRKTREWCTLSQAAKDNTATKGPWRRMSKMRITKTADDEYHVEDKDSFIDDDVNGSQLVGMTTGRTTPDSNEIVRILDSEPAGYVMIVEYRKAI